MLTIENLAKLVEENRAATKSRVAEFSIGDKRFDFNSRPAVMGVINLSADSWYRESVCLNCESALKRANVLAAQGADIIDVGAESTLVHAARLDEKGQENRLLPVIEALHQRGLLVSVETYEPEVARTCLKAGANILNLTAAQETQQFFKMAAEHDAAVIICYVEGKHPRAVGDFDLGADPIGKMRDYFARQVEVAAKHGVQRIFLDPGLGFYYRNLQDSAVRVRHQLSIFLNAFRLRELGFPICNALPHAFEYFGEEVRAA